MIDGELLHLSAGGLYNGLVLLIDDETRTYWDHITGEAVHGPRKGAQLPVWGLDLTTVEAALVAEPELLVAVSKQGLFARVFGRLGGTRIRKRGFFPPGFRATMGERDERLGEQTSGLGVVVDGEARFYPVAALRAGAVTDDWPRGALTVALGDVDRVPFAVWADATHPFQLFTRWYGFSFTYPDCGLPLA